MVYVLPERGDILQGLSTEPCRNPITGKEGLRLRQTPDGACVHLGEAGCTVYEKRPAMCRVFDCRRLYVEATRAERRRHERRDPRARALYARGRELMDV